MVGLLAAPLELVVATTLRHVGLRLEGREGYGRTAAAPGIFTTFTGGSDVLALNQDGSVNGPDNPAARGSIAALFATGAGQTTPASVTGVPATVGTTAAPASVTLAGRQAEILYAGPAPTLVGVTQVNARVPADAPAGRAAVVLTVGAASSRSGVVLWVK